MKEKISLAGDLGSGKSTVSKILIESLGAEYYSTGAIVRSVAEKRGMTVVELNKYMETHPELDREIDDGVASLSEIDKLLIIDSRMAWHFTKGTFKVYLSVDIETSALRIMTANRKGEHAATLEETVKETRERRESEIKRYSEKYGVNIGDLSNYDLVVDTTYLTPEQVAACIEEGFREWRENKSFKRLIISSERLNYPDTEADAAKASEWSDVIDCGEIPEPPEVVFDGGEFYLIGGLEIAMGYAFSMSPYIRAVLVPGSKPEGDFVRMANSL